MENDEDIFKEIMALIDKRNRLCEEWIERIDTELREGSISYEEYSKQTKMIHEEIARTQEVLQRQKERIAVSVIWHWADATGCSAEATRQRSIRPSCTLWWRAAR